jgi:hypothetical protein
LKLLSYVQFLTVIDSLFKREIGRYNCPSINAEPGSTFLHLMAVYLRVTTLLIALEHGA